MKIIRPVVDAIGELKSDHADLSCVFVSFLQIDLKIRDIQGIPEIFLEFKEFDLRAVYNKAREYDDKIYFAALFIHPCFKSIALKSEKDLKFYTLQIIKLSQSWLVPASIRLELINNINVYRSGIIEPFNYFQKIQGIEKMSAAVIWKSFPEQSRP